jgi:hypothetical protein
VGKIVFYKIKNTPLSERGTFYKEEQGAMGKTAG